MTLLQLALHHRKVELGWVEPASMPQYSVADLHVIAKKYEGEVVPDGEGGHLVVVTVNGTRTICRAHGVVR